MIWFVVDIFTFSFILKTWILNYIEWYYRKRIKDYATVHEHISKFDDNLFYRTVNNSPISLSSMNTKLIKKPKNRLRKQNKTKSEISMKINDLASDSKPQTVRKISQTNWDKKSDENLMKFESKLLYFYSPL